MKFTDNQRSKKLNKNLEKYMDKDHITTTARTKLSKAVLSKFDCEILKERIFHARKIDHRTEPTWHDNKDVDRDGLNKSCISKKPESPCKKRPNDRIAELKFSAHVPQLKVTWEDKVLNTDPDE